MLVQKIYREPLVEPEAQDRMIAARVTTLVTAIASFCFFLTPILYFGVSEDPSGWNAWLIGGLLMCSCLVRIVWPAVTTFVSYVNFVLGIWVLISPWVFGYTWYLGHWINDMVCGSIIIGYSLFSSTFTRGLVVWRTYAVPDTIPPELPSVHH